MTKAEVAQRLGELIGDKVQGVQIAKARTPNGNLPLEWIITANNHSCHIVESVLTDVPDLVARALLIDKLDLK